MAAKRGNVENSRLLNILLILLIILAAFFLGQMIWQFLSGYADVLLLFLLAWLVSFILNPAVFYLSHHPLPHRLLKALEPRLGVERTQRLMEFHLSRSLAVVAVYLGLVFAIFLFIALLVPTAVTQLTQLASHLPEYMKQAPAVSDWVQQQLSRLGIRMNVEDAVGTALGGLQSYAATLIQNALVIFTGVLNVLTNLFFVLILGFYITLDGPRLRRRILKVIPERYYDEISFFGQSVSRTFGGFIRGQMMQALLVGVGTAVGLSVLGLNFVLVASLFAGLFMLIPLVGPFLSLTPPVLVVLIQSPELTLWLFGALFVYQFVIVNILMPRLMSDAVGLHPLLVLASILIGIKIAGFWGALFGIPVAGVLWAMLVFFFGEWQKDQAKQDDLPDEQMD